MPITELDKTLIFAENLNALRKNRGWSVGDIAKHAGVPKSTMLTALTSGRTTLDTAIRISEGLGVPLGSLAGDTHFAEKLDAVRYLLQSVEWFRAMPSSGQEDTIYHFRKILELIRR